MNLGGGWRLAHLTDRTIELRKDDYTYRRFLGRDGYVRVRAEPGMDRQTLLDRAIHVAQRNDAALAQRVLEEKFPRRLDRYKTLQMGLERRFGTPQDPEIIGEKKP